MKNPFTILLAIVVLIGIVIGAAAIFFLGPTDQNENESISVASESELPTPSTRNTPAQPQSDGDATESEVVIVSTSVTTKESSTDELSPEIQERIESGEGVVVITAEASSRRGFGGGPGPAAEQEPPTSKPSKKLWKAIPRSKNSSKKHSPAT